MNAIASSTYVCHGCHASVPGSDLRTKRTGILLLLSVLCMGGGVGAAVYGIHMAAGALGVIALILLALGARPKPFCPKCGSTKLVQADSAPLTTKYFKKQMQKQQQAQQAPKT